MLNSEKEKNANIVDELLSARLKAVQNSIAEAIKVSGRKTEDITLIAVSKFHPALAVSSLFKVGQIDFAENYMQEVLEKQNLLVDLNIKWHFIGHLQSNKAKFIISGQKCLFELVHTVDSTKLVQNLHRMLNKVYEQQEKDGFFQNQRSEFVQKVLIQVNVGNEKQKHGISELELMSLVIEILKLPRIKLCGLMCIPPFENNPKENIRYFSKLRELLYFVNEETGLKLKELSMGMSSDFVEAIQEGATLVRIGTDIFGQRLKLCRL